MAISVQSNVSGLKYYPDTQPGIARQKRGRGFSYIAPDGTRIADPKERERIAALAVPPAYEQVWICPLPHGHLQATGIDARQRKQYRYHPEWTEFRAGRKYAHLAEFGRALPAIRRKITADLKADAGDRAFALAGLVAMLDKLALRIGSAEASSENGTYGATTLRHRHLRLSNGKARLTFKAKGGRRVSETIDDARLNRIFNKIDDLPGAHLFSWIDDDGQEQPLRSDEVNAYLGNLADGEAVTAKDFRTWNGTLAAFEVAQAAQEDELTIKLMAEAAAKRLHNTATIAQSSYIHPGVIDLAALSVEARQKQLNSLTPDGLSGLRVAEAALLAFLDRH